MVAFALCDELLSGLQALWEAGHLVLDQRDASLAGVAHLGVGPSQDSACSSVDRSSEGLLLTGGTSKSTQFVCEILGVTTEVGDLLAGT